jgi:hypothetical protein
MLRAGAVAAFLFLVAATPAAAAVPGRYRLTSAQGTGNELTIDVGADGRTVESTNSFVYDQAGNPYCVWGGGLRGSDQEDEPSALGDDGSFSWHAHESVFGEDADTTGQFTGTSVEADVTISGCEDLTPFGPKKPPFATVHFTGGLVGSGGGTTPPPGGSLPLIDPQPPVPPGGKPAPGTGYPGAPAPGTESGCVPEVKTSDLAGVAACWKLRGDVYSTGGRARVNGVDLTPASPGAEIQIDKRTQVISTTGPVEVRVGPLLLLRAKFTWRAHKQVFSAKGQKFLGLQVKGGVELKLEGGRTKLTVSVGVPDDPLIRRLVPLEKLSGDLTVAATNDAGIVLDQAKVTFPSIRVGFVEVDDASLAVTRPTATAYHYDGAATVYAFPRATFGIGGIFGLGIGDGYLKAGAFVEQLNKPLWAAVFLQKVGLTLQFNPFGWTGSVGATLGPQFRFGGNLVSTLRVDGSLAYLSGNGGEPSSVELSGSAKSMGEIDLGDAKIKVSGGRADVEGHAKFKVFKYGIDGKMNGWVGGGGLNLEGNVNVSVPGPDSGGEGVVSTRGLAACRRGFGPDVGFGYSYGQGLDGIHFMASSCDIGPWRELAGASAARVGASTRVRRGQRQLTLVARGAAGAPGVAFVAPDGTRYQPSAAPEGVVATDRVYLVQDDDTKGTYFAIKAPERGTWRIEPLPGGVAPTRYQLARPLPKVAIKARVRGRGRHRTLVVRLRRRAGARVTFVERGSRSQKRIGTVARGRARLRFSPAPGPRGRRAIVAVVQRDGLPVGTSRRVARYRSGVVRPSRPAHLRVRRAGFTRRISWRGRRGLAYRADVTTSDGRHERFRRAGRRPRIVFRRVPRGVRVRVRVVAIAPSGELSRPARRRR